RNGWTIRRASRVLRSRSGPMAPAPSMTTTTRTRTKMTTERTRIEAPDAAAIARQLLALKGQRVAVAMSGGVDSAVAALALVEAGADVVGLALRLHDAEPHNPL